MNAQARVCMRRLHVLARGLVRQRFCKRLCGFIERGLLSVESETITEEVHPAIVFEFSKDTLQDGVLMSHHMMDPVDVVSKISACKQHGMYSPHFAVVQHNLCRAC